MMLWPRSIPVSSVMLRLVAALLVLGLAAFPALVVPVRIAAGLAVPALAVGLLGVAMPSVPVATAAVVLALAAHGFTLAATAAPADLVAGLVFGAVAFVLLELVDLLARTRGATRARGVLASWGRHALGVVVVSAAVVLGLGIAGTVLGPLLHGARVPVVVVVGALGALVAAAGVVAVVAPARRSHS